MKVDLMVIGAHPDDIEIGTAGTVAKYIQNNKCVILIDLTQGEMGSNGNAEIRKKESEKARLILGAHKRINLGIKDRQIYINEENVKRLVQIIREYTPHTLFYPYGFDDHPDHESAHRLVREAIHTSGLVKYDTGQVKYRPKEVYNYYINNIENVSRFVDITDVYPLKQKALEAHQSQFGKTEDSVDTYLNNDFIKRIEVRDRYWGDQCGCNFAEVFYCNRIAKLEME